MAPISQSSAAPHITEDGILTRVGVAEVEGLAVTD